MFFDKYLKLKENDITSLSKLKNLNNNRENEEMQK